jgi:hypothetical protein
MNHLRISSLFNCIDYMLLNPLHVSVTQDHPQGICYFII